MTTNSPALYSPDRRKRFSRIVLFATPRTTESTAATRKALLERQKGLVVEIRPLALDDPTDYTAITQLLRQHLSEVQSSLPDHTFFVSVASGTPQMNACWVVLLRDGVFPAQILHVRPPRFVTADRPLVTLIDLTKSLPAPDKSFRSILSNQKHVTKCPRRSPKILHLDVILSPWTCPMPDSK